MIRVCLMLRSGRDHLECQWVDPVTEKKKTRTTGTANRVAAERFRTTLEADLNTGRDGTVAKATWAEFEEAYRVGKVNRMKPGSRQSINATLNHIRRIVNPARPTSLGPAQVHQIEAKFIDKGFAAVTIHRHMNAIRRLLEWGRKRQYLVTVPEFDPPPFKPRQKSRPISREKFDAMLDKLPEVVDAAEVDRWRWRLEGLWLSSLRVSEAIVLHWTDPTEFCVDLDGEFPVFKIEAEVDKGTETRLFPMVKDFAEFLRAVPDIDRTGYVFDFTNEDGSLMTRWSLNRVVGELGRLAGVVVGKTAKGKVLYASCHTFRRSFGERWSWHVKQRALKLLMRHKTTATTETFYQSQDTQETAREVWEAMNVSARRNDTPANKAANIQPISRRPAHSKRR